MTQIRVWFCLLCLGVCMTTPNRSLCQETQPATRLINLDSPSVPMPGKWLGMVDVRPLAGDEDMTHTSISLGMGLRSGSELTLRGTFAPTHDLGLPGGNTIRHGGNDVELLAKFTSTSATRTPAAFLIGVSFPNTPSQTDPAMALGGAASVRIGQAELFANPRAVFANGNSLIGFGLGASASLGSGLRVNGDWTPMLTGHNSRDTSTGNPIQRAVWGAGITYRSGTGRFEASFGYTNGTGLTTGSSLTPALGGSGGVYFSLIGRS